MDKNRVTIGVKCINHSMIYLKMLLVVGAVVLFSSLDTQIPNRCEGSIPAGWSALSGRLSLSNDHYKVGGESLRWQWHKKTAYITIKDTAFGSAARDPRSTFVIWIYNEKPIRDKLLFEFKKNDANAEQFCFNLDFKGWRTAWVMYHRDMDGQPVDGMNELIIRAPRSVNKGTLYFDQVIYNANINPRSPMRDEQVPFVNVNADKAANAHWTALYWFNRIPHYLELASEVSKNQTQEFEQILSRHEEVLFTGSGYRQISFGDLKNDFDFWKIERKKHTITGRPVYSVNDGELFSDGTSKAVKDEGVFSFRGVDNQSFSVDENCFSPRMDISYRLSRVASLKDIPGVPIDLKEKVNRGITGVPLTIKDVGPDWMNTLPEYAITGKLPAGLQVKFDRVMNQR